jgi:hypothetical protein
MVAFKVVLPIFSGQLLCSQMNLKPPSSEAEEILKIGKAHRSPRSEGLVCFKGADYSPKMVALVTRRGVLVALADWPGPPYEPDSRCGQVSDSSFPACAILGEAIWTGGLVTLGWWYGSN